MLHSKSMCRARRSLKPVVATLAVIGLLNLSACGSSVAPLAGGSDDAPVMQPADGSAVGGKHCAPLPGTAELAKACEQPIPGNRT
jgi:hypothetical protein